MVTFLDKVVMFQILETDGILIFYLVSQLSGNLFKRSKASINLSA